MSIYEEQDYGVIMIGPDIQLVIRGTASYLSRMGEASLSNAAHYGIDSLVKTAVENARLRVE